MSSDDDDDDDDDDDGRCLDLAQHMTEFVIDATCAKSSQRFRFTLLRKRKKTALQYWLTDGQRWPLLQRLACQVFSLPASTVSGAVAEAQRSASAHAATTDLSDRQTKLSPAALAKLAFVSVSSASVESNSNSVREEVEAAAGSSSGP